MYKLVIVDDEAAIRKGMCNYIAWKHMGFEVVADFEDGTETVDYINRNSVDVILTDIEMAQVSGLMLAKHIYQSKLPIKTVILSGYKEFEYAREALEYNVEHYLLKPIRMEEVQKVFGKIKDSLDQQKMELEGRLSEKKRIDELMPQLQEQFWLSLLVGDASGEAQILKRSGLLQLQLRTDTPCAVLDVKLKDHWNKNTITMDPMNSKQNIELWSNRRFIDNTFSATDNLKDNHPGILFYPVHLLSSMTKVIAVSEQEQDMDQFEKDLKRLVAEKTEAVFKLLKLEMAISVDKLYTNIVELDQSKDRFELQPFYSGEPNQELQPEAYERLIKQYKRLSTCIKAADFEKLPTEVDEVLLELSSLPVEYVKQCILSVFSMLSNHFMKTGDEFWLALNEIIRYRELAELNSINELRTKCVSMMSAAVREIGKMQNELSKGVIEQAAEYMEANFGQDLSLELVADRYYLNHSYFSRLFKQYTGSTFTEHLIQLRMEKAKELLVTGKYKVYEVSNLVGYKSEKYFFSIFRKYSGSSPAEYYRNGAGRHERKG